MSADPHDVRPEQFAMVIREMIRHENDVTNHRIMWLLVGQGFIANAYVSAGGDSPAFGVLLLLAGILVALSAFLMLFKSYQARGYLEFLGQEAKRGELPEATLPLSGWPRRRVAGWSRVVWDHRWIGQTSHVLEPWVFLPWLFVLMWATSLLKSTTTLDTVVALAASATLATAIIVGCALGMAWAGSKAESPR